MEDEPLEVTADMLAEPEDDRLEFERGMTYAPPATLALIALLAGVFVWELATGALGSTAAITRAGALVRERVHDGESWRLFSATLLHGTASHLVGNLMALYVLGMAAEHALGAARFAALYVVSALAGSLVSVATSAGPSVGASGAIFGLLGAVTVVLVRYRNEFHVRDKRIAIVLAAWAAYTILTGLSTPMIDNAAHVGGLLGGMGAAAVLRPRLLVARSPG
jgi:rhomboid protease GluP